MKEWHRVKITAEVKKTLCSKAKVTYKCSCGEEWVEKYDLPYKGDLRPSFYRPRPFDARFGYYDVFRNKIVECKCGKRISISLMCQRFYEPFTLFRDKLSLGIEIRNFCTICQKDHNMSINNVPYCSTHDPYYNKM